MSEALKTTVHGACDSAPAEASSPDGRSPLEKLLQEAFCQGQIAHYKIPRHIRFVEGFPTTVTGKVQKFAMREAMIAELDLVLEKTA